MTDRSAFSVVRLVKALGYALAGLGAAWREEVAFRLEVTLVAILAPLGAWLGESGVERALLVGSLALVVIVELVNSGLEAAVDRVGLERHALSKRAKDLGAAAVLVSVVNAAAVWLVVLLG
jgi:diacylglycerol kinase (ATP)